MTQLEKTDLRRRLARLDPVLRIVVRARFLRVHPLSRAETARLLKASTGYRYRRAATVANLEARALRALRDGRPKKERDAE